MLKYLNLKGNQIEDNAILHKLLPLLAKGKDNKDVPNNKKERRHDCHAHDYMCVVCRLEHLDLSQN